MNRISPLAAFETSYIDDCFEYLPSGILVWRRRPTHHFRTTTRRNIWLNKMVGRDAAKYSPTNGLTATIDSVSLQIKDLIWVLHNGTRASRVYFKNNNPADTRIENLTLEKTNTTRKRLDHNKPIEVHYDQQYDRFAVQCGSTVFIYHSTSDQADQTAAILREKLCLA